MTILNSDGAVPDTSIELHSRSKRKIENTQSWSLSQWDWENVSDVTKNFPGVHEVAAACPVYNCHGLTFGSRRTAVEYSQVRQVLQDDGFTVIGEKDAREGDIVLYIEENGDVGHSGFVIGRRPLLFSSQITVPVIWSKWGKGPEVIHVVPECDFFRGDEHVQFHRLTSWKDGWRTS